MSVLAKKTKKLRKTQKKQQPTEKQKIIKYPNVSYRRPSFRRL